MDSLKAYRDVKNSIDTALEMVSTATELPLEEIQEMREYPSLPRYIFLPAHARIFPWAGKNKSGYRDGKNETKFLENYRRTKKRFIAT